MKQALAQQHINSSVTDKGGAWLDFSRKGVDGALRLSPHYYNVEAEVERVLEMMAGF